MTKREGDLKLKNDEIKRMHHALVTITQCFEDQLDEAKRDIKLEEESMAIITKAYGDLVCQAIEKFGPSDSI